MNMNKRRTKTERQFTVLKLHKTFLAYCEESRKRFLQTAKFDKNRKLVSWNDKVLNQEVNLIMNLYPMIPDSWKKSVEDYIKTGELKPPKSATEPTVVLEKAEPYGRQILKIQVFKHTTKKEYLEAWKKIRELQKEMKEFNPSKITKADMVMIELYQQGKTAREIADYLSEHDIELYGEDKDAETPVESTIRSRLKTMRRHLSVHKKV